MKQKLTMIAAFVALALVVNAQENVNTGHKKILVEVKLFDSFPVENQNIAKYLAVHIDTSLPNLKVAPSGNYLITLSYTRGIDGKVANLVAENNPGYGTVEEVIKAMQDCPVQIPVLKIGKRVEFHGKLKVLFTVMDQYLNDEKPEAENYDKVFTSVTKEAEFTGGPKAWKFFLEKHCNTIVANENGAPAGSNTVMLSFLVDKYGIISDITADNNPGYGTVEECIRLMKNSPKWIPAAQNGHNVAFRAKQSFTFSVRN